MYMRNVASTSFKIIMVIIALFLFFTNVNAVTPSNTIYFAEGYTGTGFYEYLTIQNPNDYQAEVLVIYMFPDGSTQENLIYINTLQRHTIYVNDAVGTGRAVSIKIVANIPVVAERPIYFYNVLGQDINGAHNTIGISNPSTEWYFAEGYTGSGFYEYLTILNPNYNSTNTNVTYMFSDGSSSVSSITINGNRRYTIDVNSAVGANKAVSIKLESDLPLVAERPMYFVNALGKGISGAHNTIGVTDPSIEWYFAEGYTGTGFYEYLTIQNPNPTSTLIDITYMFSDGSYSVSQITVNGNQRYTIYVNDAVGTGKAVSIKLDSSQPVVAERPIYFDNALGQDIKGGHNTIGTTSPSTDWYFAEGWTGTGFYEYLTIQNPNPTSAIVDVLYMFEDGSSSFDQITVNGNQRYTIDVNSAVGASKAVAIKLDSTQPVVAERPIYFKYALGMNIFGGHNTVGFDSNYSYSIFVSKPRAYNGGTDEKIFEPNETARIVVNVTHGLGSALIDQALISLIDPNSNTTILNKTMNLVTTEDIIKTFEYYYPIPNEDAFGEWIIQVYANDTNGTFSSNLGRFLVMNLSAKTRLIISEPAETMVAPEDWLGNPDTCNPTPTQSPVNFRTVTLTAFPLTSAGYFQTGLGVLETKIYNNTGNLVSTVSLSDPDNDGKYSGSYTFPDSSTVGRYVLKVTNYPEISGEISVLEWNCHKCHMDPQTPSTFDLTTVHNIHKNTKYGNGDGCDHSQGYYGKYCTDCHYNGNTGCEECHNDYQTQHSVLDVEYGADRHLALSNPCNTCHGSLSSLISQPQCDNPTCHPLPGSRLNEPIPSDIDNETHDVTQNVPCGSCHNVQHDLQRRFTGDVEFNTDYCVDCHGEHCHVEVLSCVVCHSVESHTIGFINQTGDRIYTRYKPGDSDPRYSNDPEEAAGGCPTCHSPDSHFQNVIDQPDAGIYYPTDRGLPIINYTGHSTGNKWGNYWDNGTLAEPCWFCHQESCLIQYPAPGEAFKAAGGYNFSAGEYSFSNYRDQLNISLTNTNSTWCGSCHYREDEDYDITVGLMAPTYPEQDFLPPVIRNESMIDNLDYFFHNLSQYTDYTCFSCHAGQSQERATTSMDEFMHNIGIGGGADCYVCHDSSSYQPKVHFAAVNSSISIHRNLNSNATMNATSNEVNKICWGCHQSDGTEPTGHPDRFDSPFQCIDCHGGSPPDHASNAPVVDEHFRSGDDLIAANASSDSLSCTRCHGLSETLVNYTEPDGTYTNLSNVSHYGLVRTDLRTGSPEYSSCSYCHQNPGNEFEAIMNNTALANMYNHTDNSSGPSCIDPDCHRSGIIHDANLTIPYKDTGGMYNSSLCSSCHTKEVHGKTGPNSNLIECVTCHTDPESTEKQIHGIRYFNQTYQFSAPWDDSSTAECTTCHTSNLTVMGDITIPKVNNPVEHGTGDTWGTYWNSSDQESYCDFCHGDTTHNESALGYSAAAQGSDTINNMIETTNSTWCGSCHYKGDSGYNSTILLLSVIPPEITNGSWNNLSSYYDHTIMANVTSDSPLVNYQDLECYKCHTTNRTNVTMDTLMHKIEKEDIENCINCHGKNPGDPLAILTQVDISVFNGSIHGDIYEIYNALTKTNTTTNDDCLTCHYNIDMNRDNINGCNFCHSRVSEWHGNSNIETPLSELAAE